MSSESTVEAKARKSRGGAKDENIRQDRRPNDPNAKVQAPASKGGPATRGGLCGVHVDNRTPWIISIYIDGRYRGEVGSYGDLYDLAVAGGTRLYGRADFTDDSALTWGPDIVNCPRGDVFTWKLYN